MKNLDETHRFVISGYFSLLLVIKSVDTLICCWCIFPAFRRDVHVLGYFRAVPCDSSQKISSLHTDPASRKLEPHGGGGGVNNTYRVANPYPRTHRGLTHGPQNLPDRPCFLQHRGRCIAANSLYVRCWGIVGSLRTNKHKNKKERGETTRYCAT